MNNDYQIIITGNWKGIYKSEKVERETRSEENSIVYKETAQPGTFYLKPFEYIESCVKKDSFSD